MKSNTSLKEGDKVFWVGLDSNGYGDLVYGSVKKIIYRNDKKCFHVEEIGGNRSLSTDNYYNLIKLESIMKSHEIQYIR